ncbi:hypothetical protein [Flavobacterium sp.]|uniref:hypothetical protein n=1 Tax=Flavobacterium sp. TaxID=239 RepID=UPI001202CF73|nr:hypothetical protein [Flavobacterium sp.]RZJ71068.1 MAG: DUF4468 domain-containing protein [Flavobacterium sp.]
MRILNFIIAAFATLNISAQNLEYTEDGLRNKDSLSQTFVVALLPGKSADELFVKTNAYVSEFYKNPRESVKSEIQNKMIRFTTIERRVFRFRNGPYKTPLDFRYTTEIRIKQGKIKYEIVELEITGSELVKGRYPRVIPHGSNWTDWPVFKDNGKVRYPDIKDFIEKYFKLQLLELTEYIKNGTKKDDW